MYAHYFRAAVFIGKHDRDSHFTLKRGIHCFEFVDFNDPLVRHEFYEMAVLCVSVLGRLAYSGLCVVSE
jgi:hypothetical protein